jgi:hypothetical protein
MVPALKDQKREQGIQKCRISASLISSLHDVMKMRKIDFLLIALNSTVPNECLKNWLVWSKFAQMDPEY